MAVLDARCPARRTAGGKPEIRISKSERETEAAIRLTGKRNRRLRWLGFGFRASSFGLPGHLACAARGPGAGLHGSPARQAAKSLRRARRRDDQPLDRASARAEEVEAK